MGEVRTEVTLVSIRDTIKAEEGLIPESEIRRLRVAAVVDTGATTLIINEETRDKLGLRVKRAGSTTVAGGGKLPTEITESVEVHWQDRETTCPAVVLPGEKDILLGALPLEGMDLMVHPLRNEVIGAHGDTIHIVIKQVAGSKKVASD